MSTIANTLYLASLAADSLQPAIVETVSDNLMYVGYCSPDCVSESDPKWLIKRISTDADGIQKIYKSNGSDRMNVAWTDRKNGMKYAPNESWDRPIEVNS